MANANVSLNPVTLSIWTTMTERTSHCFYCGSVNGTAAEVNKAGDATHQGVS
jgi:hypothetical protein